jgi:acetyl-CoA acyltransferase
MIIDVVRTGPGKGKPGGALSQVHPATLLATALVALLDRNDFDPVLIDGVIVGCVTQSGEQSLNVGRTAVLAAGLSESVPAVTIDRQCGSGQQAAHFAAQGVMAGAYDVVIACGVESMSRAPMFSNTLGQDANGGPVRHRYPAGLVQQGVSAELIAATYGLSRPELDEFAARSHRLAAAAAAAGAFANEIIPVQADDTSDAIFDRDETIRADTTPATLAGLPAAFHDPGHARRFPGDRLAHHRGEFLAAHRWRLRGADHERGDGRRAGTEAARSFSRVLRGGQRPADDAHRPDRRDGEGAEAGWPRGRRYRRLRGQ